MIFGVQVCCSALPLSWRYGTSWFEVSCHFACGTSVVNKVSSSKVFFDIHCFGGTLFVFFPRRCELRLSRRDARYSTADAGVGFCLVPDVDDCFHVLLRGRVETDNAAIERLVEPEVLHLRALHVHNVDRVVVRL